MLFSHSSSFVLLEPTRSLMNEGQLCGQSCFRICGEKIRTRAMAARFTRAQHAQSYPGRATHLDQRGVELVLVELPCPTLLDAGRLDDHGDDEVLDTCRIHSRREAAHPWLSNQTAVVAARSCQPRPYCRAGHVG